MYRIYLPNEDDVVHNTRDLLQEIKNLSKEEEVVERKIKPSKKNKKDEKVKKKKKKGLFVDDNNRLSLNLSDLEKIERLYDDDYDDDDDEYSSNIINKQKKGYNKLRKAENAFKKEFAEELTLLYNLLSESTTFGKDLEEKLKSMGSSKTRGLSKYTIDLVNSITMNKNSKLSILKEIAGIKKTIADLNLKETRAASAKENEVTSERLASEYFKNIINHGMGDYKTKMTSVNLALPDQMYDSELEELDNRIESRLYNNSNPFRSEDGSKFIKYENRNVKIVVERDLDSGEWELIAIDEDGTIIPDYPIPDRGTIKKMRFSDDGRYATDNFNRMYPVSERYGFE